MKKEVILKMIDGGIVNIVSDRDYSEGCETCDYGSSYVNEFDVELTKFNIHLEAEQMYEYPLSEGDMMKVILRNAVEISNMTEEDFAVWLKKQFDNKNYELKYRVFKK